MINGYQKSLHFGLQINRKAVGSDLPLDFFIKIRAVAIYYQFFAGASLGLSILGLISPAFISAIFVIIGPKSS